MKIYDVNLPNKVYEWIQERYKFYDKQDNKYTGEKYTEQIFNDAVEHFKLSLNDIKQLYNESIKITVSKLKEDKTKVSVIQSLNNKKVKLNVDKILNNEKRNNSKFIKFVKENKDKIFTAVMNSKMNSMYNFKEDDTWLFYESDLIEIK
jgi:hypothetical protein